MNYGYKRKVPGSYDEAVSRLRETLKSQGFGIITEIDVKATLHHKLKVDFDKYVILGACNPKLAHQALLAERDLGLLLPCNTIVYEMNGETYVASILPTVQLSKVKNNELSSIAQQVETSLKKALDAV